MPRADYDPGVPWADCHFRLKRPFKKALQKVAKKQGKSVGRLITELLKPTIMQICQEIETVTPRKTAVPKS